MYSDANYLNSYQFWLYLSQQVMLIRFAGGGRISRNFQRALRNFASMTNNTFSHAVAQQMVQEGVICEQDIEIYAYGIRHGRILFVNTLLSILIGLAWGMGWQSIVCLIVFMPLRSYAGGFHAGSQIRCLIYSIMIISSMMMFVKFVSWNNTCVAIMAAISCTAIVVLAPFVDNNKPVSKKEKKIFGRKAKGIAVVAFLLVLMLIICRKEEIAVCIAVSISAVSTMLILGHLRQAANIHADSKIPG